MNWATTEDETKRQQNGLCIFVWGNPERGGRGTAWSNQ